MEASTHIVIEASILVTEHVQILERVVCREVFELNEKMREDFSHRSHELDHEPIHLQIL